MKINQYYEFCWRCVGVACGLLLIGTAVIADDDGDTYKDPGPVGTANDTTGGGTRRSSKATSGRGFIIMGAPQIVPGYAPRGIIINPNNIDSNVDSDPKQKSNPEPSSDPK